MDLSTHPGWNAALGKLVCPVCGDRHSGTVAYNRDVLGHDPSEDQAARWLPPGSVTAARRRVRRPWALIAVCFALIVLVVLGMVDAPQRSSLLPAGVLGGFLAALLVRGRRSA